MQPVFDEKTIAPTINDLLETIRTHYVNPDLDLIKRVYACAAAAHGDVRRSSGHLFISHPIAVAIILARMEFGMQVLAAALLHDVIEDTTVTRDDLEKQFGADIANLVASVTKLQQAHYRGAERYLENLRKMFLAMADDVRAILIKFADRLHNLQTLYALPPNEQKRIAREALEIHVPIAGRMGMGEMKGDLEDTAFRYDDPQAYERTKTLVADIVREKDAYVHGVLERVNTFLASEGVQVRSIHGRVKRLYSFYRKLKRYDNDISRIYDIMAIRIIVPNGIEQCYAVLGLLHKRYKPLPGRIKDYIAQPKPNGYQSLHTTVFCEGGQIVEFQIRTQGMHDHAEYGIAAHWRYKENGGRATEDMRWMEELNQIRRELADKKKFLVHLKEWKLDLFKDRIFVFTPKGDVVDLPEGGTPIDFAYAIHTDLGNACIAVRVNGVATRLDTALISGDICEIITGKNRKSPSIDWIKFVKTRHAREKIREHSKQRLLPEWIHAVLPNRSNRKGR